MVDDATQIVGQVTDTVITGTVTITPAAGMAPPCQVSLSLPELPQLTNGGAKPNATPTGDLALAISGVRVSQLQFPPSPGQPVTLTLLPILIPNRQKVSQGFYTSSVTMFLSSTGGQALTTAIATFSAQVMASCTLPAPTVTTLNFSPGIAGGRVVGGYSTGDRHRAITTLGKTRGGPPGK